MRQSGNAWSMERSWSEEHVVDPNVAERVADQLLAQERISCFARNVGTVFLATEAERNGSFAKEYLSNRLKVLPVHYSSWAAKKYWIP